MALWHGLLLMLLRAMAQSAAENIQRWAQRPEKPSTLANALGVALGVASAPMDAIAYSLAPQSVLAPVGMIGMLFSLLAAQKVHGDPLLPRDVGGAITVLAGAGVCLVYGADSQDVALPTSEQLIAYGVFLSLSCASLFGVLFHQREAGGRLDSLANALLGGILGASTIVASKMLTSALLAGSWPVLPGLAIAMLAPTHLYVLNRGYGRHSLVFMSPAMGGCTLLSNVATGYFLFSEVPVGLAEFGAGVSCICLGVLSLCVGKGSKVASS